MGVPVVKLLDQRFLSRFGASFIAAVGLRGLLAKDTGDYVRIATELAARPADVVTLRGGLRERMAETTLCNGSRFTRQLEEAYREWWRIWCERGPPGG